MTVPHRDRIYLSPPNVGPEEIAAVTAALESGWVSPLGPEVDAFEQDLVAFTGAKYAVALSSGTAGLHLALLALGVGPGDEVVVPTMTFGATAFAVTYTGASPVFLDIEERTWNLDPSLLEEFLQQRAQVNKLPAAIITVDLFGRPCDYDVIQEIAVPSTKANNLEHSPQAPYFPSMATRSLLLQAAGCLLRMMKALLRRFDTGLHSLVNHFLGMSIRKSGSITE